MQKFLRRRPRDHREGVLGQDPCMTNCKSEVKITGRAAVLDVTPDDKAARKSLMHNLLATAFVSYSAGMAVRFSCLSVLHRPAATARSANIFPPNARPATRSAGVRSAAFRRSSAGRKTSSSPSSNPIVPSIATNPIMQTIAGRLTSEEVAALASYFGNRKPAK